MTKQQALDHFGGVSALARVLGITPGAVSQWREIPEGQQYKLQVLTGGALVATQRQEKK